MSTNKQGGEGQSIGNSGPAVVRADLFAALFIDVVPGHAPGDQLLPVFQIPVSEGHGILCELDRSCLLFPIYIETGVCARSLHSGQTSCYHRITDFTTVFVKEPKNISEVSDLKRIVG